MARPRRWPGRMPTAPLRWIRPAWDKHNPAPAPPGTAGPRLPQCRPTPMRRTRCSGSALPRIAATALLLLPLCPCLEETDWDRRPWTWIRGGSAAIQYHRCPLLDHREYWLLFGPQCSRSSSPCATSCFTLPREACYSHFYPERSHRYVICSERQIILSARSLPGGRPCRTTGFSPEKSIIIIHDM